MRLDWTIYGSVIALAGLLVLLFVPDTSERMTLIDTRGARTTVEPVALVDTLAYGTQLPDFIGNAMLMLGLLGAALGLAAHRR